MEDAMGLVCKDDGWRLPDEMWAKMEPLLPPRKPHPLGGHNPRISDGVAMNAILLVLRTGMQWNALNGSGICSSSSAHRRFSEWRDAGVFERFWREGLLECDRIKGIDWAWLSLDGAMTKAPLGGGKTGPNPTDRGKGGVKRSLLTEARGIPLAIEIDGANRHDMKLTEATLNNLMVKRPQPSTEKPQGLCLDKGYDFDEVRERVAGLGFTAHIRTRGEEQRDLRELGYRARRWVVERTHSWINRFRRLLTRWEKKAESYLSMLHLACGIITWRASGLLG
jgi:transposase